MCQRSEYIAFTMSHLNLAEPFLPFAKVPNKLKRQVNPSKS